MSALPPKADIRQHEWRVRYVPLADSSQQLCAVLFSGFGHPKSKDDKCHEGGSAQCEKGRTISEMIDDLAGSQPT